MEPVLLDRIVATAHRRSAERRARLPLEHLRRDVRPDPARGRRFVDALARDEMTFLAAMERASPSGGRLFTEPAPDPGRRAGPAWRALAEAFRAGGVDALVVGTETDHYDGELEDLASVAHTRLPVMRADFLVDEGMVLESALHGAHAVQVVAAILDDEALRRAREAARDVGLAVMIEVHHERDLDRALPLAPELLGVNARDRRTMAMDPGLFARFLPRVPKGILRVALSGLTTGDDVRRARDAGAHVALMGASAMKAPDPVAALRAWRAAARAP